jgi:general secretion pathway protein I
MFMFEPNLQHRKGFTLLEVMIALAILAISLTAVFRSQSQSVSMAGEARFLTTASLLAQSKMAEMEGMKPQDLRDGNGVFGDNYPNYHWRVEVKDTAFQYLKKIDVIVTNSIMVANNAYRLELYRFIRK